MFYLEYNAFPGMGIKAITSLLSFIHIFKTKYCYFEQNSI